MKKAMPDSHALPGSFFSEFALSVTCGDSSPKGSA